LIDHSVLDIPTNQKLSDDGLLQLEKYVYQLPQDHKTNTIKSFGKFHQLDGYSITVQILRPDGKIHEESIRTSDGSFQFNYKIESYFPEGPYQISANTAKGVELGPLQFDILPIIEKDQLVPAWVKNTAGWWAGDIISDNEFLSALQFLVKKGIITIQNESLSFGSAVEIVYQTKMLTSQDPFSVILIQSTSDKTCSAEEKRKAQQYGMMAEYLVDKNSRPNPTQVTAYCMELHEIKADTFPYVLKETGKNQPDLLIYTGGIKSNIDQIEDDPDTIDITEDYTVWWWECSVDYGSSNNKCITNQIVICDECKRWGIHMSNFENDIDNGMHYLSAAIGAANFYEAFGDRWDYESYGWASNTSINENQEAFDLCHKFDILENELCSKLYEEVSIQGDSYIVMDINYAKNNWKDEQKDVRKKIISLSGVGSKFEGFSKFTLREPVGDRVEALLSTGEIETTDVLSIEYPDDWKKDYYFYDWAIWRPIGDSIKIFTCCDVFEADTATLRVSADFWKDDTRTDGVQYPWVHLADVTVWFLDNIHDPGVTNEERFAALEDSTRAYCSNASIKVDGWACEDFKVLEKSVFSTDEGRTAHSLVWSYNHLWYAAAGSLYHDKGLNVDPWIAVTTEILDGEDAWQVEQYWEQDVYEFSSKEADRFRKSLIILDTTEPIPSVPVTPITIVTEDGIQYNANKVWDGDLRKISDEEDRGFLTNKTKITKYDVVCGMDCNITFSENMDVDEVMTKLWSGTLKELFDWYAVEYGDWQNPDNPQTRGQVWDNENEVWVDAAEDKWVYESTSLERFQDENFVKEVWDIYHSITPKEIIEEIDTFLFSADDSGVMAWVARCDDEANVGCGPPDTPNSKYVLGFNPIQMAPISGELEAISQPGKIKDALEIDVLKRTLIHENAHILTLGASQSDNDMINWSEYCDDRFDDGSINWEECDDDEIRRVTVQKETACAPNFYDPRSGCTKDNSYMNKFFQKFWADIYPTYVYGGKNIISHDDFHKKYYDQFVTYYAASHPAEDIAESFSAFVLSDDQARIKTPNMEIWEEKIRFFYDFPELVEMRDFIRNNL